MGKFINFPGKSGNMDEVIRRPRFDLPQKVNLNNEYRAPGGRGIQVNVSIQITPQILANMVKELYEKGIWDRSDVIKFLDDLEGEIQQLRDDIINKHLNK
ncbi:MAG: hypothetical protein ACP5IE_06745 [Infirmifilum sp.]